MPLDSPRATVALPHYAEIAPSPDLAPWVACYWAVRADDAPPVPHRVLPDGCADLLVDCAVGCAAGPAAGAPAVAVGPMRAAAVVPLVGRVDVLGVRFRPGGALAFLDAPLRELADQQVPLDVLWGGRAGGWADALATAARGGRVARTEAVLRAHLRRRWAARRCAGPAAGGDEPLVAHAVAHFRRTRGAAAVREVTRALGVGERRLERAFDRSVGMGPKAFARVLRFRHAVRAIERTAAAGAAGVTTHRDRGTPPRAGSAVALEAGYADQAHLIREFRALAGLTPGAYAAERRAVGFVQYGVGEPS